jgi:hypothetical protein
VRASGTLGVLRQAFPTRVVRVSPDSAGVRAVFARYGAAEPIAAHDGIEYELPASTDFGALLRDAVAAGPVESFERREPSLGQIYARALGVSA